MKPWWWARQEGNLESSPPRQQGVCVCVCVCVCARAGVCLHVCFGVRRDLGSSLNVALSGVWGALGYGDLRAAALDQTQFLNALLPRKWGLRWLMFLETKWDNAGRIMLRRQQTLCIENKLLMSVLLLVNPEASPAWQGRGRSTIGWWCCYVHSSYRNSLFCPLFWSFYIYSSPHQQTFIENPQCAGHP